MAVEKVFTTILAQLDRIEAKLDKLAGNVDNTPPWKDYDKQSVADITAHLKTVNAAMRAKVLSYERANKDRDELVHVLVSWNS